MPVNTLGVTPYTGTNTNSMPKVAEDKTSLSISDFYKLLATQMKYQDADNPMSSSEMMAQMVQTQMIEAITNMSAVSTTSYAATMIGKEVTVAEVDANGQYAGKTSGIVTGVILGNTPVIYIGEKGYYLSQIMVIGKEPPPKEDTGEGDKDPDDPGDEVEKPEHR